MASPRLDRFPISYMNGYNVTFADAARRTAQIAYDLRFEGDPAFFSWPSQGDMAACTVGREKDPNGHS
jgi:esterase/lipase superfamily enzyme